MSTSLRKPPPPLKLALLMWGIAALFYLLGFFFRVTPGVLNQELMRDFGLNAVMLGNMAAFYYYAYAAMQVPTGITNDRIGPKALIVIGAFACGLGGVLFAVAESFEMAAAGRALMGFGHGMAWVSMLTLAAAWFAPHQFGLMSGLSLAVGTIGAVLAQTPLRWAADAFGWRQVMLIAGIVGVVIAALAWIIIKRDPQARGYRSYAPQHAKPPTTREVFTGLARVWGYRNTLWLFLVPGGICGALLTFTTLWGTPFLVQHHGMSTKEASYVIAAMLVAFSVGSIAFGKLSDAWQQRKTPMLLGGCLMVIGFGMLAWQPAMSTPLLIALLVLAALGSGSMVVGFAFAKESVPHALAGTATGVHNMGVMAGTLIQLPLLGKILDSHWRGALTNGVRQYDLLAFKLAFTALFLWVVASMLSLLIARETEAQSHAERSTAPRDW